MYCTMSVSGSRRKGGVLAEGQLQQKQRSGGRLTGMQFAVMQVLHDGSELPG